MAVIKGRRRRVRKFKTMTYAQAFYMVTSPANRTLRLSPTKQALAELIRRKHLQVRLSITFTASDATPLTRDKTITMVSSTPSKDYHG